ncbi:predicted protein [Theileria orientalis strain Shintoku]|uniref:J domain-containing protein n=1 Tax=Theileria orientalis strain Shintoku TaxID=869250 RepID=J4CCM3_THEOR|nr:predicted protein [Theileria orientalis strain Shintoku]PVC52487.1 hypothetical protein MACL_00000798 [Theileria orientalis]BAM39642.1 predicted protein [Theileria orientalis strain Shintoku]|eukprot:XP_009689943.1 predicted protein [Theileria orientalis strain Shintoku]
MDANKDESNKCFKMAKMAMSREDYQKALKLATKANNMYPCEEYRAFMEKCSAKLSQSNSDRARDRSTSSQSNTRNRRESASGDTSSRNATAEQENLCRKIVNSKDYYETLQVAKNCSVEEIKKSYKKLALKLHPDKNPSPLASEAFKKVSTAFQCLTNPQAREEYDQYGERAPTMNQRRYQRDFVTPEQLFEAFFGMNTRSPVFTFTTARRDQQGNRGRPSLYQFVPLLVLVVVMIVTNLFSFTSPVYDYEKSTKYDKRMMTYANGVVYYVQGRSFEYNYPSKSIQRLKLEYEIDYNFFQHDCDTKKKENQRKIVSYLSSLKNPPPELYETPKSCEKLNGLRNAYTKLMQAKDVRYYL